MGNLLGPKGKLGGNNCRIDAQYVIMSTPSVAAFMTPVHWFRCHFCCSWSLLLVHGQFSPYGSGGDNDGKMDLAVTTMKKLPKKCSVCHSIDTISNKSICDMHVYKLTVKGVFVIAIDRVNTRLVTPPTESTHD